MRTFRIAVIAGDGVGQEVVPAALRVLSHAGDKFGIRFDCTYYDWGAEYYFRHGHMMPPGALDLLADSDAIFLGAIGHPDIPDHITLNGLLLPIRRAFDQYANVRPAFLYPGVESPLRKYSGGRIDMVVVRENTEGEYAQVGGFLYHHHPDEVAIQTAVFTRRGIERVVRYAFELARSRRKHVTAVHKQNVLRMTDGLFLKEARRIADANKGIAYDEQLIDSMTALLIRNPSRYDVIVTTNMFGDILSDEASELAGGLGLGASINAGDSHCVAQAQHGSAPNLAGTDKANPVSLILSAAMLLEWLARHRTRDDLARAARIIGDSVDVLLTKPETRTVDLGGTLGTRAFVKCLTDEMTRRHNS